MRVMVLGGDGFCGWPTALHLSRHGYDVAIVDNLSRRRIDEELGAHSLTPILSAEDRLRAWHELTGQSIDFVQLDIVHEYSALLEMIRSWRPATVVHLAEQRAAPYSMKSSWHKRYTVDNNVRGTHNVLSAITESRQDVHLVHLGTMGVYGYGTFDMEVPEGYLDVQVLEGAVQRTVKIPYPPNPGSVYHMTKTLDALMFAYYSKNDRLRITDLHQGIVWGTETDETGSDDRLINRFDYDGDYGTVLNRFLMQAAIGFPLTVHGTGGQVRAFIHIRDSVKCIKVAIENPPACGEPVKIFNQATETHNVKWLAERVSELTGATIQYLTNPRNEAPQNTLRISNQGFLNLGLEPITLSDGLLQEVVDIVGKFADRCDRSKILCRSTWHPGIVLDAPVVI